MNKIQISYFILLILLSIFINVFFVSITLGQDTLDCCKSHLQGIALNCPLLDEISGEWVSPYPRHIQLKFHVIRADDGSEEWPPNLDGGSAANGISRFLTELNATNIQYPRFGNTGIVFEQLGEIDYINETDFLDLDSGQEYNDLWIINMVDKAINIYFVRRGTPAAVGGYFNGMTSPTKKNLWVVKSMASIFLPHELGHCMYLVGSTDTGNWMYTDGTAYGSFTQQQIWKMHCSLVNEDLLRPLVEVSVTMTNKTHDIPVTESSHITVTGERSDAPLSAQDVNSGAHIILKEGSEYHGQVDRTTFNNYSGPAGLGNYQHLKWNLVSSEYKLKQKFPAYRATPFRDANFNILKNVSINSELLEGSMPGKIYWCDPWWLDPITGDRRDANNWNWLEKTDQNPVSVFLNQEPPTNPGETKPYYTVRVPQTQTIDSYQNCNFIGWSATGNTQVVNPTNLESPVIFKGSNDVVKARYKGNLLSSKSSATGNNNQRKFVRDASGVYHMAYESMGEIWYTKSTDGGVTWIPEIMINNHTGEGSNPRNPSLCQFTQDGNSYLQVVWIEDGVPSGVPLVRIRECLNGVWGSLIALHGHINGTIGYNMKPVVERGWVAYDYQEGTTYGIGILKYNNQWFQGNVLFLPSGQGKQPAIYVSSTAQNLAQLVYEDPSIPAIQHRVCVYNSYASTLSWSGNPINISLVGGRTSNCNPSIAGNHTTMYAAWQGYNSTTGKTEIIVRKGYAGNPASWDGTYTCFNSKQACNSTANFSQPSIRFIGNSIYGVTWQSDDRQLFAAAVNSGVYSITKLSPTDANYPLMSEHADGSTIRIIYTKNSASAPYQLLLDRTNLQVPYLDPPVPFSPPNNQEGVGLGIWLGWNCVFGATSYRVQVSTDQDEFENNIILDQAGITGTSYQPGGLTYSITYYWRVKAKYGDGESDWSNIWSFTTMNYSPPGCPYVFSKIGNDFIIDNNIIPQSEYTGNKDKTVTDYYKLLATPTLENGKYTIEVREFERERSQLDEIKLLAVDHNLNTEIAVLPDGEIVEYFSAFRLNPNESKDNIENLSTLEGKAYYTNRSDEFFLNFESVLEGYSPDDLSSVEGGLLLGGWVVRGDRRFQEEEPPPGEKKISVGVVGGGNRVGNSSSFTFRERATLVYVPIEKLTTQVNVRFTERIAFDFASLVVKEQKQSYSVQELVLESAKHSKVNDVTTKLSIKDGIIEELYPGEIIRLTYNAPPVEQGKIRSFILIASGRYERLEGDNITRVPDEFMMEKNYPNPFNPQTTIRYQLAKSGNVKVVIYNQLGQEVTNIVDSYQEAGYYNEVWDASNTPSGIYYIHMSVTDQFGEQLYQATKKLVVMK